MGTLYRRHDDGPWYGDFYTPEGKRVQRSLRTKDKTVAKERLRAAELSATPQARGRRQLLSEAIDHMITTTLHDKAEETREMYREKRARIAKSFGVQPGQDPPVHEVTRDALSTYIARRLNPDDEAHGQASPHTVSKELITIRKALREAHDRGVLRVMPPFPKFSPRYVPREIWLNEAQFDLLCAEIKPDRVLWASLAALGGMRAGEVERLQWSNAIERLMRVPGTKTNDARRTVPIAPALRYQLDQVPPASRRGKVVRPWGNVRRDLRAAVDRANRKLAAAAAEVGAEPEIIPHVSPNDLRRTFASWLVQNGVPLLVVAKLLGHSSTRMVEKVYGQLSPKNMDEAIAVLPTFEARRDLARAPRPALAALVEQGVTNAVTEPVSPGVTPEHLGDGTPDPAAE